MTDSDESAGPVRRPGKRFLNVLAYLKKVAYGPNKNGSNITDLLLPFAGKLAEMERVLRDLIPLKIDAMRLNRGNPDWKFVAYGYLRQDDTLRKVLEEMYTPTYAYLQAEGFMMVQPDDFVATLLWDTVMEIHRMETEDDSSGPHAPPPPGSGRRQCDGTSTQ